MQETSGRGLPMCHPSWWVGLLLSCLGGGGIVREDAFAFGQWASGLVQKPLKFVKEIKLGLPGWGLGVIGELEQERSAQLQLRKEERCRRGY